ncbi:MAG: hypothetical protein GX112_09570 [Clostridiaceae bacterium]|nr:hypothetical protein [Clostridiaceae bacterium]
MLIKSGQLTLHLDEQTGCILQITLPGKTMTSAQSGLLPLFSMRLIDPQNQYRFLSATDATKICFRKSAEAPGSGFDISYQNFPEFDGLRIVAHILPKPERDTIEWRLSVQNNTDHRIEHVDYPQFSVKNDLGSGDYQSQIFVPFTEGCIVDDINRPRLKEHPLQYPSSGGEPIYPGAMTMQYMAYYDGVHGLYFAAHDTASMPKAIECFPVNDGIRLAIKSFVSILDHTSGQLKFPLVMRAYAGGWLEAAGLYREFVERDSFPLPKKTWEQTDRPKWQDDSPVVVIFPPRSIRGTGYMGPNEFFPYNQSLKYIDDLADMLGTNLLTLLTYWEGSAPWCPPFIWPPYGGEELFADYVSGMHDRGHYVGVYGSGLHWTDKSLLCPEFDKTQYRLDHDLTRSMCASLQGEYQSKIVQTIRSGYDMCPTCDDTINLAMDQMTQMVDADIDFIQYFDQNIGGRGYACYDPSHRHPAAYGQWSVDAMKSIYKKMHAMINEKGARTAIGCESSSADCFIEDLTFNDLRYNWVVATGKPVPAFSYIFHEYNINFMGNQCAFTKTVPAENNPDSYVFRLAYSLVAGDLLTITIKSGGEIHWEWGMSWLEPGPRQLPIIKAIKNYNAMRKGPGYPYLHQGRMVKPDDVQGGQPYHMIREDGTTLTFPGLLSSKWISPDGHEAQVIANYQEHMITAQINRRCDAVTGPHPDEPIVWTQSDAQTMIEIPPLSCVLAMTKPT